VVVRWVVGGVDVEGGGVGCPRERGDFEVGVVLAVDEGTGDAGRMPGGADAGVEVVRCTAGPTAGGVDDAGSGVKAVRWTAGVGAEPEGGCELVVVGGEFVSVGRDCESASVVCTDGEPCGGAVAAEVVRPEPDVEPGREGAGFEVVGLLCGLAGVPEGAGCDAIGAPRPGRGFERAALRCTGGVAPGEGVLGRGELDWAGARG
jgi:hypothetical protein